MLDAMSERILGYERLVWSAVWRFRRELSVAERAVVSADELYVAALRAVWRVLRRDGRSDDDRRLGGLVYHAAIGEMRDYLQHVGLRVAHRAVRLRFNGERVMSGSELRRLRPRARLGSIVAVGCHS